jgi:hypothetical protein
VKPGGLLTRLWGEARTSQPEPGSTIAAPDSASPPASSPRPESSASLLLTWEEAVELIRSRRGDVFEIQFLGREVDRLRASEDPALGAKAEVAREHLQAVIERKLRAKDLLPPTGELELVDAAH